MPTAFSTQPRAATRAATRAAGAPNGDVTTSPTFATQPPPHDGYSAQRPSHARAVSTCYCFFFCTTPTTHLCFCLPACLPAGTTLQTPAALARRGGGRRGEEEGGCGGAGGGEE